jgi:hypothetical protein
VQKQFHIGIVIFGDQDFLVTTRVELFERIWKRISNSISMSFLDIMRFFTVTTNDTSSFQFLEAIASKSSIYSKGKNLNKNFG